LLKEIQSRHLTKVEISPDNQYFAVSYERSEGSTILPSEVELYDLGTWNKVITLGKHETKVSDISFSPDGSLLASCGWDGSIKIWDVEQKNMVKESLKFKKFISVKFITNEIVIGGANDDFSSDLYTWELSNNKQYTTIPISRPYSIEHLNHL
jgi:WD40 repeat protein